MKTHLHVHYFQHIEHEGLGSCEAYLRQHQAQISTTAFFAVPKGQSIDPAQLPDPAHIDLLIIMGGPMSVNDEAEYPWLIQEKHWIRQFIELGKPVVGLCLGSQLIASALNAPVRRNPVKEVSWAPVHGVSPYPADCFVFPQTFEVMQWHGDTFDLPEGAKLLASNPACAHQAFQYGANVIGTQFHPEITPHAMAVFLEDEADVQDFTDGNATLIAELHAALSPDEQDRYTEGNRLLDAMIDYVVEQSPMLTKTP